MNNQLIDQTIDHIFVRNEATVYPLPELGRRKRRANRKELELALTVILVDLASSDQNFEQREYIAIGAGLRRLFGESNDLQALVNRAQLALANLRGTQNFADLLRASLSEDERHVVAEIIDSVIGADGIEDGFEQYLRLKYRNMLDISTNQTSPSKSAPES